ncbi:MAG TPA: hypothetical protein ENI68_09485 [Gammaproteobacteria bacterium]|nr:hypothetical protein [Gammaproteobacteria bacterium]
MMKIVINKIFEFGIRLLLVFYGMADLIGIIWYLESIYVSDLIQGLAFLISALFVGLIPTSIFQPNKRIIIYISVAMLGIVSSGYMAAQYIFSEYRGWYDIGEQLLLMACFIYMIVKTKMSPVDRPEPTNPNKPA